MFSQSLSIATSSRMWHVNLTHPSTFTYVRSAVSSFSAKWVSLARKPTRPENGLGVDWSGVGEGCSCSEWVVPSRAWPHSGHPLLYNMLPLHKLISLGPRLVTACHTP